MGIVRRFVGSDGAYRWDGVTAEPYATGGAGGGTRQVLIGPADGAARFALRYFVVPPGATSTLETHAHDHGVFVLHGQGRVRLGDAEHAIGVGDVVYVGPHEVHRFEASGTEPLGFLCVVPARR
jgi:quercetin dioxygenase-like cupin family protein